MSDLSHEELEEVRRYLAREERKESLGDMAGDGFFDLLYDRPHMIVGLATLAPKQGEPWTEERLLLWLEVVEKTARLVYGLDSEWSESVGAESPTERVRANVAADTTLPHAEQDEQSKAKSDQSDEPAHAEGQVATPRKSPSLTDQDGQVLATLAKTPDVALTRREIAHRGALNHNAIADSLTRLRSFGRIERVGTGSATKYLLPRRTSGIEERAASNSAAMDARVAEVAADARSRGKARAAAEVRVTQVEPTARKPPLAQRISDALIEAGRPLDRYELYEAIGQAQGVGAAAAGMARRGELRITEDDCWALPEDDDHGAPARSCRVGDCTRVAVPESEFCDQHAGQMARFERTQNGKAA